ncbi:hypothetical protein HN827_05760 [archaeon]|jgi:hypothetical protein|nr:hypothetical protein [archaeon]MBT4646649.1 hypothetical protein [archaeon]MBT6821902.1 hypothetical protein [archaeon]MBT7392311.1 hypothetical protein [archaeon]
MLSLGNNYHQNKELIDVKLKKLENVLNVIFQILHDNKYSSNKQIISLFDNAIQYAKDLDDFLIRKTKESLLATNFYKKLTKELENTFL